MPRFFSGWAPVASWVKHPQVTFFLLNLQQCQAFPLSLNQRVTSLVQINLRTSGLLWKPGEETGLRILNILYLFFFHLRNDSPESRIFLFAFLNQPFHQNHFCSVRDLKWPFLKFSQSDYFSTEVFKIHRHLFSVSCLGNYSSSKTNALLQPSK